MKKKDSILKKLWDRVSIEQWQKFLRVVIICMVFMVISEGFFEIPVISNFFGKDLIIGKTGWIVYAIVWIIMFIQVAIIPIPALPILVACNQIPNLIAPNELLGGLFSLQTILFAILVTSATTLGAITSYWIGRTFGKPAIKWIAGSDNDYKIWSKKLNSKTGKWIYASTVLLPIFPDDLISLVVGSIKMKFSFYVIVNIICKFIGLYTMLIFMRLPGVNLFFNNNLNTFPIALTAYTLILLIAIIWKFSINKIIQNKQPKQNKLKDLKEDILNRLNKKISVSKDLILDYKINKRFKTYLTVPVKIEKLFVSNNLKQKQKIRIIIKCQASNYWEIIFDKVYELTDTYNKLIQDIKQHKF